MVTRWTWTKPKCQCNADLKHVAVFRTPAPFAATMIVFVLRWTLLPASPGIIGCFSLKPSLGVLCFGWVYSKSKQAWLYLLADSPAKIANGNLVMRCSLLHYWCLVSMHFKIITYWRIGASIFLISSDMSTIRTLYLIVGTAFLCWKIKFKPVCAWHSQIFRRWKSSLSIAINSMRDMVITL